MALFLLGRRISSTKPQLLKTMAAIQTYSSAVTSGKAHVNGVDLYYEQTGEGKHALLLLPGALGSTRTDFGPQLKHLNKERFTVVGWDPRGYGQSRPPDRDFPMDFFERDAKDAVDLMQALGFSHFSLLGWSDGGITAMIAAGKNPDMIRKLVVWGANAFVSKQDLELYNGNICMDLLPLISCSTLIVHGEKDPMVPGVHPQYLLEHIKESRLHMMPEGKHNLHLRYAAEFNKMVEEFLED